MGPCDGCHSGFCSGLNIPVLILFQRIISKVAESVRDFRATNRTTDPVSMPFREFEKIARLKRNVVITEKIDGTNACVVISPSGLIFLRSHVARSSRRMMTTTVLRGGLRTMPKRLAKLGEGYHYGEWWGSGIQRRYGMDRKVFSLFNVGRWTPENPNLPSSCCSVVPILSQGALIDADNALEDLKTQRQSRRSRVHEARGDHRVSQRRSHVLQDDHREGRRVEGETEVNGEHKTPSAHGTEERRVWTIQDVTQEPEAAIAEIERLRETLTFPRITPEAPAEQLMAILHDYDKGRPVNAQDLINALAWRVRNQRREIAKLHERLRKKQSDEAPSFSPNFDERNGIR